MRRICPRVIVNSCNDLYFIRYLDQVIIGASRECRLLRFRILVRGDDHNWYIVKNRRCSKVPDEVQTGHIRHAQYLKYDGGMNAARQFHGSGAIRTIRELDIRMRFEGSLQHLCDQYMLVNQQDANLADIGCR